MTIVAKSRVREAYERARDLGSDHEEACRVVARALGLEPEVVDQVVQTNEVDS